MTNQKPTVRSGMPPKAGKKSGGGQLAGNNVQPKAAMLMGLHTPPSFPKLANNAIIIPTAAQLGMSVDKMNALGKTVTAGWMK